MEVILIMDIQTIIAINKFIMKKIFYILIAITISTISNGLYSQNQSQPYAISIGGLLLEHQYSHEQVISALGNPQSYEELINNPDYEGVLIAKIYLYNYNRINIYDGILRQIDLINSYYKLNGIVGVGDPASKINDLPHNNIETSNMNNGQSIYYLYFRNIEIDDMSPIMFKVENGIITRIEYIYCDDV
jgi:hypothetical protein